MCHWFGRRPPLFRSGLRAGAPVYWMEVLSFLFLKMKGMFVCWVFQTRRLVCDLLIVVVWSVTSLCLNMTDTLWVVLIVIVEIIAAATRQLKRNHLFVWLQWKIAVCLSAFVVIALFLNHWSSVGLFLCWFNISFELGSMFVFIFFLTCSQQNQITIMVTNVGPFHLTSHLECVYFSLLIYV